MNQWFMVHGWWLTAHGSWVMAPKGAQGRGHWTRPWVAPLFWPWALNAETWTANRERRTMNNRGSSLKDKAPKALRLGESSFWGGEKSWQELGKSGWPQTMRSTNQIDLGNTWAKTKLCSISRPFARFANKCCKNHGIEVPTKICYLFSDLST